MHTLTLSLSLSLSFSCTFSPSVAGLVRALSLSFSLSTILLRIRSWHSTSRLSCPPPLFFLATAASVLVLRPLLRVRARVCVHVWNRIDVCQGSSLSRVHVPRPGSSCSTFPWPRVSLPPLLSLFLSLSRAASLFMHRGPFRLPVSRASPRDPPLAPILRRSGCAAPRRVALRWLVARCVPARGVHETRERPRHTQQAQRSERERERVQSSVAKRSLELVDRGDGTRPRGAQGGRPDEIWPVTYRHVQDGRRLRTRSEGIPGCCTGRTSLKSLLSPLCSLLLLHLPHSSSSARYYRQSAPKVSTPDKGVPIINTRKWRAGKNREKERERERLFFRSKMTMLARFTASLKGALATLPGRELGREGRGGWRAGWHRYVAIFVNITRGQIYLTPLWNFEITLCIKSPIFNKVSSVEQNETILLWSSLVPCRTMCTVCHF